MWGVIVEEGGRNTLQQKTDFTAQWATSTKCKVKKLTWRGLESLLVLGPLLEVLACFVRNSPWSTRRDVCGS